MTELREPSAARPRLRALGWVLVAAVCGLLVVQLVVANRRAGRLVGLTFDRGLTDLVVETVSAGGPAERAVMRLGGVRDRLRLP